MSFGKYFEKIDQFPHRDWLNKNRNYILAGFLVVATAVLIKAITPKNQGLKDTNINTETESPLSAPVTEITPAVTVKKTITPNQVKTNQDYQNASTQFEGRRIQFNNCQANPTKMTVTNSTKVMFDNHLNEQAKIYVNNVAYTVEPFGFKIVALESSKRPATMKIDCVAKSHIRYNTAQITIQ